MLYPIELHLHDGRIIAGCLISVPAPRLPASPNPIRPLPAEKKLPYPDGS